MICLLPIFLCGECDIAMDREYNIYMINNSQYDIISIVNSISIDRGRYYTNISYPDTILSTKRDFIGVPQKKSNEKYAFAGNSSSWEAIYKHLIPNDTISVFVFDSEVLDTYPWEEVRDEYKILKRYDLSLEDLQKLNFTLHYPPTKEMKDMKMYPPYE